jgi:hypothetical protein
MTEITTTRLTPKELLGDDYAKTMSLGAARLYASIWNRMNETQCPELVTINDQACSRAHIEVHHLPMFQRELAALDLLDIELDTRPEFAISAQRTVYRLPHETANERDA